MAAENGKGNGHLMNIGGEYALTTILGLRSAALASLQRLSLEAQTAAVNSQRDPSPQARQTLKIAQANEKQAKETLDITPRKLIFLVDLTDSMQPDERKKAAKVLRTIDLMSGTGLVEFYGFGDKHTTPSRWLQKIDPQEEDLIKMLPMLGGSNRHESLLSALDDVCREQGLYNSVDDLGNIQVYGVTDEYDHKGIPSIAMAELVVDPEAREQVRTKLNQLVNNANEVNNGGLSETDGIDGLLTRLVANQVIIHAITPDQNCEDYHGRDLKNLGLYWSAIAEITGGDHTILGQDVFADNATSGTVKAKVTTDYVGFAQQYSQVLGLTGNSSVAAR